MSIQQMFLGAGASAPVRALVQLRFESSPGFLIDEGLAASTWFTSGFNPYSGYHKEGSQSAAASGDAYAETTATSGNCVNGTGDGAMGAWVKTLSGGYIAGVRNVSPYGGAETGIAFYQGGSANDLYCYWGNGGSVQSVNTTGGYANADTHLWVEQYTPPADVPRIYFYVNGVLVNTGGTATGGAIPIATGAKLRIGNCLYPSSDNACGVIDSFQVFGLSLYEGASSFTPPGLAA